MATTIKFKNNSYDEIDSMILSALSGSLSAGMADRDTVQNTLYKSNIVKCFDQPNDGHTIENT